MSKGWLLRINKTATVPSDVARPWITMAAAVDRIYTALGGEIESTGGAVWPGDRDAALMQEARGQITNALGRGDVVACASSDGDGTTPLSPEFWAGRRALDYESMLYQQAFYVRADDVHRLWPIRPGQMRPGRPDEYDWARLEQMHDEELRHQLSDGKLIDVLRARHIEEFGVPGPSITQFRTKIRAWRARKPATE